MLTLPVKKKWFDMIWTGGKNEEYREIKPYWRKRFSTAGLTFENGMPKAAGEVLFVNGYGNARPAIRATVRISIGQGRPEWGAEPEVLYFRLKILKKVRVR